MKIHNIEKFFKSKRFSSFTKLDGVALMHAIKLEVIEFNYDLKALEKFHRSKREAG